jgi:hypothetical protein
MAAVPPVAPVRRSAPPAIGLGGLWPIAAALLVFGGVGALIVGGSGKRAAAPMAVAAVVPAVLPPAGAGVTEQVIDGRPQVSIYFDTAKSDIYPNFEARTEGLRKWLAENPGHHLEISGFNDPRGMLPSTLRSPNRVLTPCAAGWWRLAWPQRTLIWSSQPTPTTASTAWPRPGGWT